MSYFVAVLVFDGDLVFVDRNLVSAASCVADRFAFAFLAQLTGLTTAVLRWTRLRMAVLGRARLRGTRLRGAIFSTNVDVDIGIRGKSVEVNIEAVARGTSTEVGQAGAPAVVAAKVWPIRCVAKPLAPSTQSEL